MRATPALSRAGLWGTPPPRPFGQCSAPALRALRFPLAGPLNRCVLHGLGRCVLGSLCTHAAVQTQLPWDEIIGEQIGECFFPGFSCGGEAVRAGLGCFTVVAALASAATTAGLGTNFFPVGVPLGANAGPLPPLWLPALLLQLQFHAVARQTSPAVLPSTPPSFACSSLGLPEVLALSMALPGPPPLKLN